MLLFILNDKVLHTHVHRWQSHIWYVDIKLSEEYLGFTHWSQVICHLLFRLCCQMCLQDNKSYSSDFIQTQPIFVILGSFFLYWEIEFMTSCLPGRFLCHWAKSLVNICNFRQRLECQFGWTRKIIFSFLILWVGWYNVYFFLSFLVVLGIEPGPSNSVTPSLFKFWNKVLLNSTDWAWAW